MSGIFVVPPDYEGKIFFPSDPEYKLANNLYATSTYGETRNMNPGAILQPKTIADIQGVVQNAVDQRVRIAVRSGGHQYSGASSTGPQSIQFDLSPTFRDPNTDLKLDRDTANDKVYLRLSVSWKLTEIFDFFKANGVFMPTGQCATVYTGGHVQTGGYGMLARSFGLLGDYVRELEIVDHKGDVVKVNKGDHPDLFYGFLGGSPGNLGVLTHFTVEVQDDQKYQGSKGQWTGFLYRKDTLQALLDILVRKGEDVNFPRGYDFTVNIISPGHDLTHWYPGSEEELRGKLPADFYDGGDNNANLDLHNFKFPMIIVYAQWVNIEGEPPYSPDLFNEINKVPHFPLARIVKHVDGAMSAIASMWLFEGDREFPLPYVKRTNTTKSVALSTSGWSGWFSGRIDELVSNKHNGLSLSSQLQVYGGKGSMFQNNAGNGTSYCFRDATFGGTWDAFYQGTDEAAQEWQAANDLGREKYFSEKDRRVLWGSYGDWDMKNVWEFYYDKATYERMQKIRQEYDPKGTFTANPFCVEALQ